MWLLDNPDLSDTAPGDGKGYIAVIGDPVSVNFFTLDFVLPMANSGQPPVQHVQQETPLFTGSIYAIDTGRASAGVFLAIPELCTKIKNLSQALPGRFWCNEGILYVYATADPFNPTVRISDEFAVAARDGNTLSIDISDIPGMVVESVTAGGRVYTSTDFAVNGSTLTVNAFSYSSTVKIVGTLTVIPEKIVTVRTFLLDERADIIDVITYQGKTYLPAQDQFRPAPCELIFGAQSQTFSLFF